MQNESDQLPSVDSDAESETSADPDADIPPSKSDTRREHYIPIRKVDLDELLPDYRDLSDDERQKFHDVCLLLDALIHYQFHRRLSRVLKIYGHLDPDAATIQTSEISDLLRESLTVQFFDELESLLDRANYVRLDREEVLNAVEAATQLGVRLHVDLDIFNRLEVYARGSDVEVWTRRSWTKCFRKVDFDVAVFRRLIIAFRLRDHETVRKRKTESADHVYVKTFKNIPHSDLDVLLPGTTVKMSLMDRSKIILPTLSGVAINLFKAWRTFVIVTVFASVYSFIGWIGLLVAIVAYLLKMFFGYSRTQDKYRLSLTQHLYFQNLDNNKGGLYRILNEAEEQDFREATVAYFVLWREQGEGLTAKQLDERCEEMLSDITGHDIDFEVDDALQQLAGLQIASCDTSDRWTVLPPDQTLIRLDQTWDGIFPYFNLRANDNA